MSIHDGHRKRLRQRFLEEGLEHFTDVQILELMLYYAIPRQDTNALAHALIGHFGSLWQVLDAPVEELCKVKGVGENAAVFLRLITQVSGCYMRDRASKVNILPTLESCAAYLQPYFYGQNVEMAYILCLDAKCKLLACRKLAEGNVNVTSISIRKIVETALLVNASSVLLAHNHPGGMAIPSYEDIATTRSVAAALQAVEVRFIDHLIICEDDYVSLTQSGYLTAGSEE